jgi:hypothetical protein
MARRVPWHETEQFTWADYPPAMHPAIVRSRYLSQRLPRCSLCGRPRTTWGVYLHPQLKQVEPPPGLAPKPYALCAAHRALTPEELGPALYGEGWLAL